MDYVNLVTALAVLQSLVFGFKVGAARGKYGILAPAVSGHEIFDRRFRVQQNTLELLMAFVPGLYLYSRYFNPLHAAALGVVYLLGREIYGATYVANPKKRSIGFGLSFLPIVVLVVGGGIGAVRHLLAG